MPVSAAKAGSPIVTLLPNYGMGSHPTSRQGLAMVRFQFFNWMRVWFVKEERKPHAGQGLSEQLGDKYYSEQPSFGAKAST